ARSWRARLVRSSPSPTNGPSCAIRNRATPTGSWSPPTISNRAAKAFFIMARKPPGPRPKKTGPVRDWHLWSAVGHTVDPLLRRKSADPKVLLEALESAGEEPETGTPRDT